MRMNRTILFLGAAAVLGVAVAQGVKSLSVTLAGKTVKLDSVVVSGKTYVSLEQLKKAFPAASGTTGGDPAGGANAVAAVSGCIGELLFNGAWRFRVQKLEYSSEDKAWGLTLETRNGMPKVATIVRNGANYGGQDMSLVLASGNSVGVGPNEGNALDSKLLYKNLAPGATATAKVLFYVDDDADKPTKFLWAMSATSNQDRAPLSKEPGFRVDLTCQK
jgi:hypothetical protein